MSGMDKISECGWNEVGALIQGNKFTGKWARLLFFLDSCGKIGAWRRTSCILHTVHQW